MRQNYLFAILALTLCLTGCSQEENSGSAELPDLDSIIQEENSAPEETQSQTLPDTTESEPFSSDVYYLTSHQTIDSSALSAFKAHLEQDGFIWKESEILDIPSDADMLIYNSPVEDLTTEECKLLEQYMENGGKFMLFLPASESETKYKFLEHLLETFCIMVDYDHITQPGQESDLIALQLIATPDRMAYYDESMSTDTAYMRNVRSFHILSGGNTDELFIDVMLQTSDTVIGEPCGGVEDDPLTYENEKLNVLTYSRDALRKNASVIVCGASDFLLDENFDDQFSALPQNWIYSSLYWFYNYNYDF